jgi:transcriptional regulator with PAS, ATPase and Fis domain
MQLAPAPTVVQMRRYPMIRWNDPEGSGVRVVQHRTVVGSSASSDLVIRDATISRVHVMLEPLVQGLVVRDLDSLNGTFVDGARIKETVLQTSSELRLGNRLLEIDFENGIETPTEVWPEECFHLLVGRSLAMRELFALLAKAAASPASVLIQGETGTGKELVARSLHAASARASGPFVVVDCAALPETLLEAELFGHTKGAFTGAVVNREGAIESANGGTVFLDEIGELPMAMQPKLLRVLEQRTVRRIGESEHRPVDVRFVSATNRNLLDMVALGRFREDLYFRLCVIPVTVPALRERREDIDVLVESFFGDDTPTESLLQSLREMPWRGNVRELRNFVERARALGEQGAQQINAAQRVSEVGLRAHAKHPIGRRRATVPPAGPTVTGVADFHEPEEEVTSSTAELKQRALERPLPPDPDGPDIIFDLELKLFRAQWIDMGEQRYLQRLLKRHNRNIAEVAKVANVDPSYIYRLVKKYRL